MTALLSLDQAADHMGVCRRTVRRWVDDGLLPARRIGPRLLRVSADDLDRLGHPVPHSTTATQGVSR